MASSPVRPAARRAGIPPAAGVPPASSGLGRGLDEVQLVDFPELGVLDGRLLSAGVVSAAARPWVVVVDGRLLTAGGVSAAAAEGGLQEVVGRLDEEHGRMGRHVAAARGPVVGLLGPGVEDVLAEPRVVGQPLRPGHRSGLLLFHIRSEFIES